jgi:hypothetical protein
MQHDLRLRGPLLSLSVLPQALGVPLRVVAACVQQAHRGADICHLMMPMLWLAPSSDILLLSLQQLPRHTRHQLLRCFFLRGSLLKPCCRKRCMYCFALLYLCWPRSFR